MILFAKTLSWGFWTIFFPTGTYTGIGTSVSILKHVMKSTTKKKVSEGVVKTGLTTLKKMYVVASFSSQNNVKTSRGK